MDTRTRTQLLALFAAGTVLFAAGCDQRNASTSSTATKPTATAPTPADKMANAADKTGDKMASAAQKTGDKVDDAALTAKVKTALMAEPGLRSLAIDVDTRDNVVTLNGTVDTQEKKQQAMKAAQAVEGVKSVSDNLVVKAS